MYLDSTALDEVNVAKWNLYSEKLSLVGLRSYSLLAKLENYKTTASDLQFGTIEIVDPCD